MKEWIPFLQTIAWIALISVLITVYRRKISVILDAVSRRIAEGSSLKVGPVEIGELKTELSQVRHELDEANDKIQKLFLATMAPPMFENLKKLTQNSFGEYTMSSGLERELYHLRDIGYIEVKSIQAIPKTGENLSAYVKATTTGRDFVTLRESVR